MRRTDRFFVVVFDINDAPTVDAVPVVRCKDCVHWREAVTNDKGFLICPASGMEITDSDFCSYGERNERGATYHLTKTGLEWLGRQLKIKITER